MAPTSTMTNDVSALNKAKPEASSDLNNNPTRPVVLTAEQRARIKAKRAEALQKRQQRMQKPTHNLNINSESTKEEDSKSIEASTAAVKARVDNLPQPKSGTAYIISEAVSVVITRTVAETTERADLVKEMLEQGYIPSDTTFYARLGEVERGGFVRDGPWRKAGRPSRESSQKLFRLRLPMRDGYTCSFFSEDRTGVHDMSKSLGLTRYQEYQKHKAWWGTIRIKFAPVRHTSLRALAGGRPIRGFGRAEHFTLKEYLKDKRSYCRRDFSLLLGQQKGDDPGLDWNKWRAQGTNFCKLYFSPEEFPPPQPGTALLGKCPAFQSLTNYIRLQAAKSGSPVICCGGHNERIFRCCDWKQKRRPKRARGGGRKEKKTLKIASESGRKKTRARATVCNFHFIVRWDEFGFFIHLNHQEECMPLKTVGYPYHTCAPRKNVAEGKRFGIEIF